MSPYKLDAIICTYNRPELVINLVNQLKNCEPRPDKIYIVDSSDEENELLSTDLSVVYIRSNRKSQPYQRFLGLKASEADIVVYFDDDVTVLKNNLFEKIKTGFQNEDVVGVSLAIQFESGVPTNRPSTVTSNINKTGKISWLGKTTGLPKKDTFVEYFQGAIMAYRKNVALKLFDEYMFTIFEKRISIPEDKAISMRASKFGKLFFFGANDYLHHPPIPSTYYSNEINFIAKTTFSRLWISKIYADVRGKSKLLAYLYFYLYFFKQIFTSLGNKNKFRGNLMALKLIFRN